MILDKASLITRPNVLLSGCYVDHYPRGKCTIPGGPLAISQRGIDNLPEDHVQPARENKGLDPRKSRRPANVFGIKTPDFKKNLIKKPLFKNLVEPRKSGARSAPENSGSGVPRIRKSLTISYRKASRPAGHAASALYFKQPLI